MHWLRGLLGRLLGRQPAGQAEAQQAEARLRRQREAIRASILAAAQAEQDRLADEARQHLLRYHRNIGPLATGQRGPYWPAQ